MPALQLPLVLLRHRRDQPIEDGGGIAHDALQRDPAKRAAVRLAHEEIAQEYIAREVAAHHRVHRDAAAGGQSSLSMEHRGNLPQTLLADLDGSDPEVHSRANGFPLSLEELGVEVAGRP